MVDVETVRLNADCLHIGAKLPQHGRRDFVGGAVRAIGDDAQALKREMTRQGRLREFDVARARIVDAFDAAEFARRGEAFFRALRHQPFDFSFRIV